MKRKHISVVHKLKQSQIETTCLCFLSSRHSQGLVTSTSPFVLCSKKESFWDNVKKRMIP